MSYVPFQILISPAQGRKLVTGGAITVKHGHAGHGHSIYLTKTQVRKIQTSHSKGKGCRISMSEKQLKHNIKHGAGFLDFFKKVGNTVANVAQKIAPIAQKGLQLAAPALRPLADQALGLAGKTVGNFVGKFNPQLGAIAEMGVNKLGNAGLSKAGLGVKRGRKKGGSVMRISKTAVMPHGFDFNTPKGGSFSSIGRGAISY